MKYNFDQIIDRRSSDSIKWHYYEDDVLPLWVADTDFVSPQPVVEALRQRVEHGVYGYPNMAPCDLPPVLAAWLEEHFNWKVEPEALTCLPGVAAGFNLACQLAAQPGEGILVQPPVYPPIWQVAASQGMLRQQSPLVAGEDGAYHIDRLDFEAAFTPETRLFLLCNPHNPVGRVFTQEELGWMAEQCLRRDVLICSDEIHCDLVYSGHPHTPIAALDPEIAKRTITLMAPSKTFNLAGLKTAFAIIPNPELRKRFKRARRGLASDWLNIFGLTAARAAYSQGHEWLEQQLAYLEANRDFLFEFVQRELPGVKMARPEGTYLAWLDCRALGLEPNPSEFFVKQARVGLNDGAEFGPGGEGFVRLNFGCPRSTLVEALERMKAALDRR